MAHLYLGAVYLEKGLESLVADHFYRAGLLFLKQGDREKALMAYGLLKEVNSKEQEQKLYEKLYRFNSLLMEFFIIIHIYVYH